MCRLRTCSALTARAACPVRVVALFDRKVRSSWNALSHGRPIVVVEFDEGIPHKLHELEVRQLPSGLPIRTVQDVSVLDGQLEEIFDQLVGPPTSSPGEGVILHELIEKINPSHVPVVVTNNCWSLHCHLLVVHSTQTSGLSPLTHVLDDGLMSGGDHGHQPDPLPADDEDGPLTTPLE